MKNKERKTERKKKRGALPLRAPFPVHLLLTVPLAAAALGLVFLIQPGSREILWNSLSSQPSLLALNFFPIWMITAALTFLFRSAFTAAAVAGAFSGFLSLISRTMIEKRDEPLTPKDISLIKEAGNAMRDYGISVDIESVLLIAAFTVLLVLLAFLVRGKRPHGKKGKTACFSVIGAALCVLILTVAVNTVYSSADRYNSFEVDNRFYITGVYNELGFPYCFCYNFNTNTLERPEGFSAKSVEAAIRRYPETENGGLPINVVIVMNEAFSDLTNNDVFAFSEAEDPLAYLNSLRAEDRAICGHIVVPNVGAGTANTEFDVITGLQTCMIREGSNSSAFRVLNHDIDSLFGVFGGDGYFTEFIHPGQNWFYNRQNAYRYFGAEKMIFSEAFTDAERKGSWVTDHAVFEKIRGEFEAAAAQGTPFFNYTTTIQNHMAYTYDKYGYVSPAVPLKKSVDDETMMMLSVYTEGVRDGDAMLREMTAYFDTREEPVLVVYFGDHLPNLGDEFYAYRNLGIPIGEGEDPETTLWSYETPYVIWANEAAAASLDFTAAKADLGLPADGVISANFLGAVVLELTGRGESDSYFAFLNDLRKKLPVFHNGTGKTIDGTFFTAIPPEYAEDIRLLRSWEYYKLKNMGD